jgi:serine/threonine protein kinase
MSPEHATGSPVDGRSDLYSLGVLLFEMLTGERPFSGDIHQLLRHHLTTTPPRIAERRPALAGYPELQILLDRALAKKREERFADAGEFLQQLSELERRLDNPAPSALPRNPRFADVVNVSSSYASAQLAQLRHVLLALFWRCWPTPLRKTARRRTSRRN